MANPAMDCLARRRRPTQSGNGKMWAQRLAGRRCFASTMDDWLARHGFMMAAHALRSCKSTETPDDSPNSSNFLLAATALIQGWFFISSNCGFPIIHRTKGRRRFTWRVSLWIEHVAVGAGFY